MREVGKLYDIRKLITSVEKEFYENKKHMLTLEGAIHCMEEFDEKFGEQEICVGTYLVPVSAICKDIILFLEEMQDAQEQSQ